MKEKRAHNFKDITGQRFGRLIVLNFIKRIKKHTVWNCKCDCGNYKEIRSNSLVSKLTRSCGCIRIETATQHGRDSFAGNGVSGFNQVKASYKRGAEKRNLIFNLNDEQLDVLFKGNCYYCNIEPYMKIGTGKNTRITEETRILSLYVYNGIDRVDNSVGYIFSNCVSCCKKCNLEKKAVGINIIEKAYRFLFEGK